MESELHMSSELYQTFPRVVVSRPLSYEEEDKDSYTYSGKNNSFPKFTPVKSKYSSTESDFSIEDEANSSKGELRRDSTGGFTLSGFSTSASSSGRQRWKNRRRRRISRLSLGSNGSEIRDPNRLSLPPNPNLSIRLCNSSLDSNISSNSPSVRSWGDLRRSSLHLPVLNSINDLKHATGRHRGISGSLTPAIDSALFAMFYCTDIFDHLLGGENLLRHSPMVSNSNYQIAKEILGILRKEIVYSLRTSYFCPAGTILKLVRILEENFPLERFQDPASFIDLVFSKVVNGRHLRYHPFITYLDGSSNYVFHLGLKDNQRYFTRNNHNFGGCTSSIQNLLEKNLHDLFGGRGGRKFITVPYPAFIIQIERGSSSNAHVNYGDDDDDILYSKASFYQNCCDKHRKNYPVIPNLEIDLTTFISWNSPNYHKPTWRENDESMSNSFMTISTVSSEKNIGNEYSWREERYVGVPESRWKTGLRSAWNIMYRYLEDFASSPSTHFPSAESSFMDKYNESGGYTPSRTPTPVSSSSTQSSFLRASGDHHLTSSRSSSSSTSTSSLSFTSCTPYPHPQDNGSREENTSTFSSSSSTNRKTKTVAGPVVKMELIAIICKSDGNIYRSCSNNDRVNTTWRKNSRKKVFSGYSVYCKAKPRKDPLNVPNKIEIESEEKEYAPWILYQSRSGVAPQVTLIENFGKWISSLEDTQENFSLYHVPLEIRRVLEDSELLIYQRSETP